MATCCYHGYHSPCSIIYGHTSPWVTIYIKLRNEKHSLQSRVVIDDEILGMGMFSISHAARKLALVFVPLNSRDVQLACPISLTQATL